MSLQFQIKNVHVILIHVLLGTCIFYFIVHPFAMVLHWFEDTHTAYSISKFIFVLKDHLVDSFSLSMIRMSTSLTVFGGFLGLLSGIMWIQFKEKNIIIKKQEHLLKRDIKTLIEMGESEWVEFKSSMRYDLHKKSVNRSLELVIAKAIVGFMNAKGGKLIIGVSDNGQILGLQNDYDTLKHKNKDGFEMTIFKIISNCIDKQACFKNHVSFYNFEEKEICLIDIESTSNPVYLSDGENTTFYVRTGNATYPLSVKETVKYLKNRKT